MKGSSQTTSPTVSSTVKSTVPLSPVMVTPEFAIADMPNDKKTPMQMPRIIFIEGI